MQGVEAEGIDFILRFRDAASDQIQVAEQSYRRLVSAMQEVIQTHRAFGSSVMETLNQVAKQMSTKAYPLVTPLTMNEGQLGVMEQFKLSAVGWFQAIAQQFVQYVNRARAGVASTEALRSSIVNIVLQFKEYGSSLRHIVPMLEEFTKLRFGNMQSDPFRRLLIDVRNIVKAFMDWIKASPEWQKHAKEMTKQTGTMADQMNRVAQATQKANFHGIDNESILRRQRKEAGEAQKTFDNFLKTLGNLTQLKWAIGTAGFTVASNQFIQKFSSMEDAALAVRLRVGEVAGSLDDLVARFSRLGKESRVSGLEAAGAFTMIAQKSGRVTEATDVLTRTTIAFAKLANTAPEYAGQISGSLVGALKMTEQQAGSMLRMAIKAQQGARNMASTDFLETFTSNIDLFERAAHAAGQSLDVFVNKNAAAVMGMQKALSNVYGDAQQATKMVSALSSAITDDAKSMMAMSAWGQENYFNMRELMKQGRMDQVYATMIQSAKQMFQESGGMINERVETFARAVGMEARDIQQLARMSEEDLRRFTAELRNTNAVQANFEKLTVERRGTLTGMLEEIATDWDTIVAKGGMILKAFVYPLVHGFAKLLEFGTSIPGVTESLVGLTMAFGALSTLGTIRLLMGWVGMGGWLTRLVTLGGHAPGLGMIFGRLTGQMAGTAAAAGAASTALKFGEVGGAVATGGILSRVWTWFRTIGASAREAAADVLNLGRSPRQLSFTFEEPGTSRISGFLSRVRDRVTSIFRTPGPTQLGLFNGVEAGAAASEGVLARVGRAATATGGFIKSLFTKILGPDLVETIGSGLSRVLGSITTRMGGLAILGRTLTRVLPFVGWTTLGAEVVVVFDNLLRKLGPVGALLRVIMSPITLVAKLVLSLANGLWDLIKSAWDATKPLSALGSVFRVILSPFKMLWDLLKSAEGDLNRLADSVSNVNGLFGMWDEFLGRIQKRFEGSWFAKALQFFKIGAEAPQQNAQAIQQAIQQQQQAQQVVGNASSSIERSTRMLYEQLKQQGVVVEQEGRSIEEWNQKLRQTLMQKMQNDAVQSRGMSPEDLPKIEPRVEPQAAKTIEVPIQQPAPQIIVKPIPLIPDPVVPTVPQIEKKSAFGPVVTPAPQVEPPAPKFTTPQTVVPQVQPINYVPEPARVPQVQPMNYVPEPSRIPHIQTISSTPEPVRTPRIEQIRAEAPASRPRQVEMVAPSIENPEVKVAVNPILNVPEIDQKPLESPALSGNYGVEKMSKYLTEDQSADNLPMIMAALQRSVPKVEKETTVPDNSDVVQELQNIGRMIQVAINKLSETKRLPQAAPAFNPRFGKLAEGSI